MGQNNGEIALLPAYRWQALAMTILIFYEAIMFEFLKIRILRLFRASILEFRI